MLDGLIVVYGWIILVQICNVIGANVLLKSVLCLLLYINSLSLDHHDVDRIHKTLHCHTLALIGKFHTFVHVLASYEIDRVAKLFLEAICSYLTFLELKDFN